MSDDATLDEFAEFSESKASNESSLAKRWDMNQADEIMEITRGASPRPKGDPELFGGDIPWIKIGDVDVKSQKYTGETEDTVTEKGAEKSKLVDSGTLLVSNSGTCGYPMFAGTRSCVHDGWLILRDYENDLNPHYLYEYISWQQNYLKSLAPGSTQINLNTSRFGVLEIAIPPLSEQRKIATVLHTVDQAIQKTEEIINKRQNIRKLVIDKQLSEGFFEHDNIYSKKDLSIFEGGINTDLDRTSVGTVPQDWDTVRLEEITESSLYGVAESAEEYDAQKPRYIRITDISSDGRLKSDDPASLSSDKFDEKYMMSDGEILFARSGATVGKTYLYQSSDPSSVYGGYLIRYVPNTQRALPKYIFYYTQSTAYSNWVTRVTRKGAQANINAGEYASILLPLPPIREQKQIVDVITSHERAIAKEISYQNTLSRVKHGLMQDLLSGEIRTTDTKMKIPEEVAKYG